MSKNYRQTVLHRKRISEARKRWYSTHINPMRGKHRSEEFKRRVSESKKGLPSPMRGVHRSEEFRHKVSEARKGLPSPMRGILLSEEVKRKISESMKGKHQSEETRRQISESVKRLWTDPNHRDNVLRAVMKSNHLKPNGAELSLLSILDKTYPSQWKYVGDGQLIIGGKCPDFANVNGKKALIELFGDYWHRNDDPQDKINHYRKYGFETLVIWERDLKDPQLVIQRISSLVDGE